MGCVFFYGKPHEVIKANRVKWTLGVLYGNGAFYSLTARRKGSCVTIPVQIPKSPFYSARLYNLVWHGVFQQRYRLPLREDRRNRLICRQKQQDFTPGTSLVEQFNRPPFLEGLSRQISSLRSFDLERDRLPRREEPTQQAAATER